MNDTQNFSIISGIGDAGAQISFMHVQLAPERFSVEREGNFPSVVSDAKMTTNGFTVGQRNRAMMHAALDAWIDKNGLPDNLLATDEQCARFNGEQK